jgi:preprotein translocase subunit YajC
MLNNLLIMAEASTEAGAKGGAAGGSGMIMIGYIAIFGFLIYFMMRGQKKQRLQRQQMIDAVKKGDQIVTSGGVFGTVREVQDKFLRIDIADNVTVKITKGGVGQVVPEETDAVDTKAMK